MTYWSR